EIASPLQCNGKAISLKRQKFLAENRPKVLSKGERLPFFRSESTCFQVLNFGNNILQFYVDAWCRAKGYGVLCAY
uniref:hypothetical protein n=1 Tax=Prevotella sp. TaxID=59823 RepID=UPI003FEE1F0F